MVVCLSILNTWDGPDGVLVIRFHGYVINFRISFNKRPTRNEPGFGDCKQLTSRVYNAIIEHEHYVLV